MKGSDHRGVLSSSATNLEGLVSGVAGKSSIAVAKIFKGNAVKMPIEVIEKTTTNGAQYPASLRHLAIIMDGNGRWAKARGKSRIYGHRAGAVAAKKILNYALDIGIPYLTLFAFSSENWRRPKHEVDGLMRLLEEYLDGHLDSIAFENFGNGDRTFACYPRDQTLEICRGGRKDTSMVRAFHGVAISCSLVRKASSIFPTYRSVIFCTNSLKF